MSTSTALPPPVRSTTDRKLLGVCGGFAQRYGIDPLVVRIAVVVLAFFGGLGVVLYLAGAVWLPEPDDTTDALTGRRLPVLILAVLAALLFLPAGFIFGVGEGGGLLLLAAVIGLVVLMVRRPVQPVPVMPEPAATYGDLPYPAVSYGPSEPLPPRQRSYLGLFALLAGLIWFGGAWFLNGVGATSFSAVTIFGVTLLILAIGILVGAWVGRARWLVLLALPLTGLVWVLSLVPSEARIGEAVDWFGNGVGATEFAPDMGETEFTFGIGEGVLDAARVSVEATRVTASLGAGELLIYADPARDLIVNAEAGVGVIARDGVTLVEGRQLTERVVVESTTADAPALTVDADVRFGQITVITTGRTQP